MPAMTGDAQRAYDDAQRACDDAQRAYDDAEARRARMEARDIFDQLDGVPVAMRRVNDAMRDEVRRAWNDAQRDLFRAQDALLKARGRAASVFGASGAEMVQDYSHSVNNPVPLSTADVSGETIRRRDDATTAVKGALEGRWRPPGASG